MEFISEELQVDSSGEGNYLLQWQGRPLQKNETLLGTLCCNDLL